MNTMKQQFKLCVILLSIIFFPSLLFAQQTYENPILGGDYPDPTIMREGNDYYMTHSAFDYQPGLTIFHSTDLIHWEPIGHALEKFLGSVWAPDICKYKDRYYIYFTVANPVNPATGQQQAGRKNYVTWAKSPHGPWSEPIDLNVGFIDPCHIVGEDGTRWLFLSGGNRAKLADDGLSIVDGTFEKVYGGWPIPKEWLTEGMALEGPKLKKIGEYFYYVSAEGGTAGPPTSHMVVVARSKSINGPWENSPYNPVIHCYNNNDRWWSRGHGSLIDTPDGRWYCVYHAYENGFYNLGRQTLMEPVELTNDKWFRPVLHDVNGNSVDPSMTISAPLPLIKNIDNKARLNEFRIGYEWKFYKNYNPQRVNIKDKTLTLSAKGDKAGNSSPLMFVAGNHSYEVEAEIILNDKETQAGIVLMYDSTFNMGLGISFDKRMRIRKGTTNRCGVHPKDFDGHIWIRIRNDNNLVTGYHSYDGKKWSRESWGMDCSGYNHNTLHQFQSVLPALYVCGKGSATFKNIKYTTE